MQPRPAGDMKPDGLLGRDREMAWIEAALQARKAGLILGPKGIGKSALLARAREMITARGLRAAWTSRTDDLQGAFEQLAACLGIETTKRGRRLPGRTLLARVLHELRKPTPAVILVDDADRSNRAFGRALRRIVLEGESCLLVAGRSGPHEQVDRIRNSVFAGTNELHLEPLTLAPTLELARRHLPADSLGLADEMARASRGIPAAVVEMARRCTDPRYRIGGRVSFQIILADLRLENRV